MVVTADWMLNTHGILLRRCQQVAQAMFVEETTDLDFSPTQYSALAFIHIQPGINQHALGEHIALDRSSVTKCLDTLESRKLIRRDVDSKDRRARLLFITAAGEETLDTVHAAALRARQRIEEAMGKTQFARFIEDMKAFSTILDETR